VSKKKATPRRPPTDHVRQGETGDEGKGLAWKYLKKPSVEDVQKDAGSETSE
jgi:hypothetical protein